MKSLRRPLRKRDAQGLLWNLNCQHHSREHNTCPEENRVGWVGAGGALNQVAGFGATRALGRLEGALLGQCEMLPKVAFV